MSMVNRPTHINAYEFAGTVGASRAATDRRLRAEVDGIHNAATMAQMEVAAGQVCRAAEDGDPAVVSTP